MAIIRHVIPVQPRKRGNVENVAERGVVRSKYHSVRYLSLVQHSATALALFFKCLTQLDSLAMRDTVVEGMAL